MKRCPRIIIATAITACIAAQIPHAQAAADNNPPTSSLFFTQEETSAAQRLAQSATPPGQGDIRLGAIIYYDDEDWIVWMQGEKWTPETSHENMKITKVSEDSVSVSWKETEASEERLITLRPHQSYRISTGEIVANP